MNDVAVKTLLNTIATLASMASGLVATVLVARMLGPEGSGVIGFLLWLSISVATLTDRGIPQTLLRYSVSMQDARSRQAFEAASLRRFLPLPVLVFVVALVVSAIEATGLPSEIRLLLPIGAALFLLYALSAFAIALARGRGDFATPAYHILTGSILQIPFVVAGGLLFGAAGALAGMAIRYIPQVLPLLGVLRRLGAGDADDATPEMRQYARNMWISDVVSVVAMTRIEYAVLAIFLTSVDLGLFAVAIVFANLVDQLALQISSPLLVSFSSPNASRAAKASLYQRVVNVWALLLLPIAFGGAAIMHALLTLVFGMEFEEATIAAAALLVAAAPSGLSAIPWTYLAAYGHAGLLTRVMLGVTAAYLPVLFLAVAAAGLEGVAFARLAAEAAIFLLLFFLAWRVTRATIAVSRLAAIVACALATAAIAATCLAFLGGLSGTLVAVAAGGITYVATLRLCRVFTDDDIRRMVEMTGLRPSHPLSRVAMLIAVR